jgi:RNA polymerase sigma factor (sigma-70 family)
VVQADDGTVEGRAVDPGAEFDSLYEVSFRRLVRGAMAIGATRAEAEDAVNQAMLDLYRKWPTITEHQAWVRRAVFTTFVKQRERDRKRASLEGALSPPEATDGTELNLWEDERAVVQMLERLPPAQRAVMACIYDDLTPAEIAVLLGKTQATVRKNLQLARDRLKQEMERRHLDTAARPGPVKTREEAR